MQGVGVGTIALKVVVDVSTDDVSLSVGKF